MFDRSWGEEVAELEAHHFEQLALLLEFGGRGGGGGQAAAAWANPIELRKTDPPPPEIKSGLSQAVKDQIKTRYIVMMANALATEKRTICFSQILSGSPMVYRLRLLRERGGGSGGVQSWEQQASEPWHQQHPSGHTSFDTLTNGGGGNGANSNRSSVRLQTPPDSTSSVNHHRGGSGTG
jgi:hypothetical protein